MAALHPAAQTGQRATIAFIRTCVRKALPGCECLALVYGLRSRFPAGLRFAVQRLRHRSRTSGITERDDLHLKQSTVCSDTELMTRMNLSRRFHRLTLALNPPEFTRSRCESPRLEETRSPKPFIETNAIHRCYCRLPPTQLATMRSAPGSHAPR